MNLHLYIVFNFKSYVIRRTNVRQCTLFSKERTQNLSEIVFIYYGNGDKRFRHENCIIVREVTESIQLQSVFTMVPHYSFDLETSKVTYVIFNIQYWSISGDNVMVTNAFNPGY